MPNQGYLQSMSTKRFHFRMLHETVIYIKPGL